MRIRATRFLTLAVLVTISLLLLGARAAGASSPVKGDVKTYIVGASSANVSRVAVIDGNLLVVVVRDVETIHGFQAVPIHGSITVAVFYDVEPSNISVGPVVGWVTQRTFTIKATSIGEAKSVDGNVIVTSFGLSSALRPIGVGAGDGQLVFRVFWIHPPRERQQQQPPGTGGPALPPWTGGLPGDLLSQLPVPRLSRPGAVVLVTPIGLAWYDSPYHVVVGAGRVYNVSLGFAPPEANASRLSMSLVLGGTLIVYSNGTSAVYNSNGSKLVPLGADVARASGVYWLTLRLYIPWNVSGDILVEGVAATNTSKYSYRLVMYVVNETVVVAPAHIDVDRNGRAVVRFYTLYKGTAIPANETVEAAVYSINGNRSIVSETVRVDNNGVGVIRFDYQPGEGYRVKLKPEHGETYMFQVPSGGTYLLLGGVARKYQVSIPACLCLVACLAAALIARRLRNP